MKCKICGIRKPRRYCPGVGGDICSICCGTEREVTVNCPLDCLYLQDAHIHEKPVAIAAADLPNKDVPITDNFLQSHYELLFFTSAILFESALKLGEAIDNDVREALDSLTRTYRTLQSGLVYESKPANPIAAAIHENLQEKLAALRSKLSERGVAVRDAEILGILVFLQRLETQWNNGRPKSRAFIDALRRFFHKPGAPEPAKEASPLILT